MMIGPDPMTSTLWMSVRFGIGPGRVPRSGDGRAAAKRRPALLGDVPGMEAAGRESTGEATHEVPQPGEPLLDGGSRRGETESQVPFSPEGLPGYGRQPVVVQKHLRDVHRALERLAPIP